MSKQSRSSVYGAGAGGGSSRPTSPRWTMQSHIDEDTPGPDSFPFIPTYDAAPPVAPGRSTIPSSSSYVVSRSRAASPIPMSSSSSPAKSKLSKQRPPSLAPSSLSSSPSATYAYAAPSSTRGGGGGVMRAPPMGGSPSGKLTKSRGNTASSVSSSLAAKLPRRHHHHHKLRSSGSTAEHLNSEEILHMIDPAYYSASSPSPGGRAGSPAPYYPYSPSPYSPSVYSASASRRRFSGGGNDYDDDDDDLQESDEDEYDRAKSYSNHRNSYQSYATTTPTSAHGHGGGPDLSRPYTDAEGRLHDPAFRLFDVEIAPHVREKRAQQRSASANTMFSSYTAAGGGGGGRAASPSLYAHSLAPSTNQNHATKQKSKLQYGAVTAQLSPPSDSSAVRPASYDPLLGTSTMRSLDGDEYEDAEDGRYAQGESPEYASALDHAPHLGVGVGVGVGGLGPSPVSPSTVNAEPEHEHEHEVRTDSGYGASPASPAGPVRSSIGMVTTDSSGGGGVKGPSTMGTTTNTTSGSTTTTTGGMITAAESSMHTSTNADASPSAGAGPTAASSAEQQHDVDHVNSQHQHQHEQEHATPQLQKRILSIHLDAPTPTPPGSGSGPGTRPGTPGRSGTGGSTTLPYRPHPVRELSRSTLYPRPVVDSAGGSNTAFGVGFHSNPHSRLPSAPSLLIPNSPQARSVSSSSLSSVGGGGDEDAKRRRRRRRARDALSMMPEGYYSDEDEDNPFKPVVVTPLPASTHHGHAHGGSSHGHGLGTKTLVPGLHAPSKTKVAAKVKAKKDELKREIFHSGAGTGEAEKSTSSGAHPHSHASHPARGQLSRAVSTISGDEGGIGEKRNSRHAPAHGRSHSHSRSRLQQQHLHQGQPSRELSLARESSAGAVSGGGGRLGYVPSHHGKSVSLRPGVQVIEDDYAPGCTDGLRRSWQSFKLSLRFGAFRTRKRIERKVAAIKG